METVDYGVCRLSVVSVRAKADARSHQINQLLFGDHYEVLTASPDKKWLLIRIFYDLSEGWISRIQHHGISREYFDQINQADFKITTDIASTILFKKSPLTILMGSIVPISNSELFKIEEQFAFNGESKSLGQKRDFEFLRGIIQKYMNAPEEEGGKTPFGIDGPGLNQMVFKLVGYMLSHSIDRQASQGKKIHDVEVSRPGDLAFFKDSQNSIIHTGIILDETKIIHVYGQVRIDLINEEGILNQETKIYTHSLHSIRRILND
jgi:Cell wall-associated hydrolases (invasion-associated proteins)